MVTWYCSKSSARRHHEILPQSSEQFWQDEHLYLYPLMVQWTQCHNCETWIICFVNCTKALLPGNHCSFFYVCVCTFGGFRSCRVHLWSAQTHHTGKYWCCRLVRMWFDMYQYICKQCPKMDIERWYYVLV